MTRSRERAVEHESIRKPGWGLLLLEGRALLELVATLAAYPLLRQAPRGDGHPVLVLPAYMTSDFSTACCVASCVIAATPHTAGSSV